MTVQTKRFIELPDILAIRFACKHCGVTLSFPLTDNNLKSQRYSSNFLDACPSCHREWAVLGGSSYADLVTKATAALNQLRDVFYGEGHAPLAPIGFSVSFEITHGSEGAREI